MDKLRLFNTFSKSLEVFEPNTPNKVSMYICGPTVYDSPHIGHARTYISFDIIRNILTHYFGFDVTLVMNITDIDDKIITRAAERKMSCAELSSKYEDEFFEEMDKLGVKRPDFVTRVTEYVTECITFIEKLEANGYAYESNGSVYFNLQEYKKAFKYNLLRPESQKEEDSQIGEKKSRDDFVLWKASKPEEPIYESRWGPGRPGWHIECSAMASSVFGPKLDIHAGGVDLAFPHHENEIAQCQGHHGSKWVNYFLHTGHLNIDGLKMSKSLKNFLTIKDILAENTAVSLRVLFLQHAWNKDMNYDAEQLKRADATYKRLANFVSNAESLVKRGDKRSLQKADLDFIAAVEKCKLAVHGHLANNINTQRVLEEILELVSVANQGMSDLHSDALRAALNFILRIMCLFGIKNETTQKNGQEEKIAEILNDYRSEVRSAAKTKSPVSTFFALSDIVREEIKKYGFVIEDGTKGSQIRKI